MSFSVAGIPPHCRRGFQEDILLRWIRDATEEVRAAENGAAKYRTGTEGGEGKRRAENRQRGGTSGNGERGVLGTWSVLHVWLSWLQEYQKVVDAEWGILYDKLEKIVSSGAKVVLSKLPIGDVATQYFADRCVGEKCVSN